MEELFIERWRVFGPAWLYPPSPCPPAPSPNHLPHHKQEQDVSEQTQDKPATETDA